MREELGPSLHDLPPPRGASERACRFGVLRGRVREVDQRRLDAPADVLRVAEIELGEDAVDVALDCTLGQHERSRDRGVAVTLGDQREDLELARGQRIQLRLLPATVPAEKRLDDRRVDYGSTLGDGADRALELGGV